jgi:hypothetical protein
MSIVTGPALCVSLLAPPPADMPAHAASTGPAKPAKPAVPANIGRRRNAAALRGRLAMGPIPFAEAKPGQCQAR